MIPGSVIAGNTDLVTITESGRSQDWTDGTHGNKVSPDYSVIFPDETVNVITITIPKENWKTMVADMTAEFGAFGASSGGAGMQGGDGLAFTFDPVYVGANITFNGKEWTDVGIRWKGQSTLGRTWKSGSYKISMRLDFDHYEDENPDIKNQRFYGFDELDLKSAMGDDSLIRDKVVPEIFQSGGVVAPETAFYRVYIDHGEGPVYFGLYTMIENVEDTVIKTQFSDDSGNLYKPEGDGAMFAAGSFNTESFEKKTNEDEADWSDVQLLYTVLNSDTRKTDPARWRQDLERVLDVDEFIHWLAINTAIQNWDAYGVQCKNFYLYTDPADGKITWIPWDNNEALSGGNSAGNPDPNGQVPQGTRNLSNPGIPSMISNVTGRNWTNTSLWIQKVETNRTLVLPSIVRNVTGRTGANISLWTQNADTQGTRVIPSVIKNAIGRTGTNTSLWAQNVDNQGTRVIPSVIRNSMVSTGASTSWANQRSSNQETQLKNITPVTGISPSLVIQRAGTIDPLVNTRMVKNKTPNTGINTAFLHQPTGVQNLPGNPTIVKNPATMAGAVTALLIQRSGTQETLEIPSTFNNLVTDTVTDISWQPPGAGIPGIPPQNQNRPNGMMNVPNAGGGQMGSPRSLGLTEVGENWPLIRYLMDDPVYYQLYLDDLDQTVNTAFEPSKMEKIYRQYHNLIEPYVTGQYGEQKGYTNLNSAASFASSLDQLILQVNSRYDAVVLFLSGAQGSQLNGGI